MKAPARLLTLFLVSLLALALTGGACRSPANTLRETPAKESIASAPILDELRQKAEQGDPQAQFNLAFAYSHGENGQPLDYAEAMKWYRMAAEQGHIQAQFNHAGMYAAREGVPINSRAINLREAAEW